MNLEPGCWAKRFASFTGREAISSDEGSLLYEQLIERVEDWHACLDRKRIFNGQVIVFRGAKWDRLVPLFLALTERGSVAVPLLSVRPAQEEEFIEIANADVLIDVDAGEDAAVRLRAAVSSRHQLLEKLRERSHPGLILFSSGSTGKSKAILHDLVPMLEKYDGHRPANRIICFLLLDHIGGVNTLFYTLSHGGTIIPVMDRSPEVVCRTIANRRAEILPTSPSFLNLLLLSGAYCDHDLTSLRIVTYGTELMPASTLRRLHEAMPGVDFRQTYGLSEVGILQSKSRPDGSLWLKVGGEGYETKIVDGVLWVRAKSAMMGYLNAPAAFDAEGWFNTEDVVEQEGEWLRFLGRRSEIINVGGLKVYPAEVEAVLLDIPGVLDATVRGQQNELLGQVVVARMTLEKTESPLLFRQRIKKFCRSRLPGHMVPVHVEIVDKVQHNERFKRTRFP